MRQAIGAMVRGMASGAGRRAALVIFPERGAGAGLAHIRRTAANGR